MTYAYSAKEPAPVDPWEYPGWPPFWPYPGPPWPPGWDPDVDGPGPQAPVVPEPEDPPEQGPYPPDWGDDRPEGDLYAFGGKTPASGTSTPTLANDGYDVSIDTWAASTSMPYPPRWGMAYTSVRHYPISFGGETLNKAVALTTYFDGVEEVWIAATPGPDRVSFAGACNEGLANVGQKAFVFGGLLPHSSSSSTWSEG